MVEVPELRRGDGEGLFEIGGFAGGDGLGGGAGVSGLFAIGIEYAHGEGQRAGAVRLVDDGGGDVDVGAFGGDDGGPVVHVNGVGDHEVHMAVDAGAGIPARGGLTRIVGADGDHVGLAEVDVVR